MQRGEGEGQLGRAKGCVLSWPLNGDNNCEQQQHQQQQSTMDEGKVFGAVRVARPWLSAAMRPAYRSATTPSTTTVTHGLGNRRQPRRTTASGYFVSRKRDERRFKRDVWKGEDGSWVERRWKERVKWIVARKGFFGARNDLMYIR